jgi:acetyltransferase-like isoleucine patch superfamily enzyme
MMGTAGSSSKVEQFMRKGIRILNPSTVTIGEEVALNRISGDGVVLHPGCTILGPNTLIMAKCEIGCEGPVTIENCQLGPLVKLNGGYFSQSTFLDKVSFGLGAHVRAGCLLEEEANGAHAVGLKQTILFPFVTLGSLINFCDCLMAGGTSRKNHSEVGSSYIHFNYTPDQDKATPSLIGDVPRGVMLNQKAIFLGGQGGLVGPMRLGYGTVIAAGTIYRKDFPQGDGLLFAGSRLKRKYSLHPGLYHGIKRIIANNMNYIASIIALRRWYSDVRSLFLGSDPMEKSLHEGAVEKLEMIIAERIKRLGEVAENMPRSIEVYRAVMKDRALERQVRLRREFLEHWPRIEEFLTGSLDKTGDPEKRDNFLNIVLKGMDANGGDYVRVIQGIDRAGAETGTQWLQGLVDEVSSKALGLIPAFSR